MLGFGFHQIGDGGIAKNCFNAADGLIQPAMQRAEVLAVRQQGQRTTCNAANGINGLYDIKKRQHVRIFRQHCAAMQPALRLDHS